MKIDHSSACVLITLVSLFSQTSFAEVLDVAQDAHVNGKPGKENVNYGSSDTIKVAPNNPFIGLVQFDLGGVSGNVSSASITFAVEDVTIAGWIDLYVAETSWDESSVTFNTRPALAGSPIASIDIAAVDEGGQISADIAAAVQGWLSTPSGNFGLAIVSAGANIRLTSKEGSSGASLNVSTNGGNGSPKTNSVTVAPEGGDYNNPADAADNAFNGDEWCDPGLGGCKINMLAGEYTVDRTINLFDSNGNTPIELSGAGSQQSVVNAGPGVDIAIASGSKIDSLTISNVEPSINDKIGIADPESWGIHGDDLWINVEGGNTNRGIAAVGEEISLKDSYVEVRGGTRSVGIDSQGSIQLENVEVNVSSEIGGSTAGIVSRDDDGYLEMTRSVVRVAGDNSVGLVNPELVRSSVISAGGTNAVGVLSFEVEGGIDIFDSEIRAFGTGSRGVLIRNEITLDHVFDNVLVTGDSAFFYGAGANYIRSSIRRTEITESRFIGRTIALELDVSGGGGEIPNFVDVDGSHLQAPIALQAGAIQDSDVIAARFGASKLSGTVNPGAASLTCVFTYDGDYQALDATCH